MDAIEVLRKIEGAAQSASKETRECEGIRVGQVVRQGDIYLHRVADDHPRGNPVGPKLAMGDLMNARHIAEAPAECFEGTTLPAYCAAGTFLGPVIVSPGVFVVSHPEHAAYRLGAGTYQVTHQADARTLERVRD